MSGRSDGKVSGWWKHIRSLRKAEWLILILTFLIGLCLFLWGFILDMRGQAVGRGIMGFAAALTIPSMARSLQSFIRSKTDHQRLEKLIDDKLMQLRKDLRIETILLMKKQAKDIATAVANELARVKNMRELGFDDVLPDFSLEDILRDVEKNSTLFLQRLFFSNKEYRSAKETIPALIVQKNVRVQILLSSFLDTTILRKRKECGHRYQKALHLRELEMIVSNIIIQLYAFLKIRETLPTNKRHLLELRIHGNYTLGPITGYNDVIIYGFYLNQELADESIQHKSKGSNTVDYLRWYSQFRSTWDEARPVKKEDIDRFIDEKNRNKTG